VELFSIYGKIYTGRFMHFALHININKGAENYRGGHCLYRRLQPWKVRVQSTERTQEFDIDQEK
jgi:hypothetical protein